MLTKVITLLLVVVGLINFIPVMGLLSAERLQMLYGLNFNEPNLQILMRHRALLFGLLGGFMIIAAFHPPWQPLAFVFGFASMLGFIFLAMIIEGTGDAIQKIVMIDVAASLLLVLAMALYVFNFSRQGEWGG